MKKCKKLTAAVLAVAMAVTGLPSVTADGYLSVSDVMKAAGAAAEVNAGEESPAEDFEYKVNEDGCITITGYNGKGGDVVIPGEIEGKKVTVIGYRAFSHCTPLTSVKIPNSVTEIGDRAFSRCTSLTSINVDEKNTAYLSVDGVLFNKDKTELIQYPAGKTDKSYSISNSVTVIVGGAFEGCTLLTAVEIPDSVTKIGGWAFSRCTSLTSINVDEKNTAYLSVDGVLFNKDKTTLIQYPAGKTDKNYSIPKSVTEIDWYAFYGCTSLTSVEIPNSVTEIGGEAFSHCTSLTSVEIPDSVTEIRDYTFPACTSLTSVKISGSVTEIGYGVFLGCTSLTSIDVDEKNTVYSSADGVLFNKDKTTLVLYPAGRDKNYSIPKSVTEIGASAFLYCTSLASVKISDSVTEIGNRAFDHCTSLTSVEIPDSVTKIGWGAFSGCTSLTIYGYTDSYAEKYANENKITFVSIDNSNENRIGDPNGDNKVSTVDAKWVLQAISGSRTLTEEQKAAADVNKDGKITTVDAKWILQVVSGSRVLS